MRLLAFINNLGSFSAVISHGKVAKRLRCGEIFNDCRVTNFIANMSVKKFEKRPIFVTVTELLAHLGVVLRMAMHQCGGIQHFVCTQWIDFTPFHADVFSQDRFNQIHWMLHVQPPSADDDSARLSE